MTMTVICSRCGVLFVNDAWFCDDCGSYACSECRLPAVLGDHLCLSCFVQRRDKADAAIDDIMTGRADADVDGANADDATIEPRAAATAYHTDTERIAHEVYERATQRPRRSIPWGRLGVFAAMALFDVAVLIFIVTLIVWIV